MVLYTGKDELRVRKVLLRVPATLRSCRFDIHLDAHYWSYLWIHPIRPLVRRRSDPSEAATARTRRLCVHLNVRWFAILWIHSIRSGHCVRMDRLWISSDTFALRGPQRLRTVHGDIGRGCAHSIVARIGPALPPTLFQLFSHCFVCLQIKRFFPMKPSIELEHACWIKHFILYAVGDFFQIAILVDATQVYLTVYMSEATGHKSET
jgi:hypothetical protein